MGAVQCKKKKRKKKSSKKKTKLLQYGAMSPHTTALIVKGPKQNKANFTSLYNSNRQLKASRRCVEDQWLRNPHTNPRVKLSKWQSAKTSRNLLIPKTKWQRLIWSDEATNPNNLHKTIPCTNPTACTPVLFQFVVPIDCLKSIILSCRKHDEPVLRVY